MNEATPFRRIDNRPDFPHLEQEILELWDRTDAFVQSVELRPATNEYTFYDGPPFPTGSPHYGNLLAGIIKDMVPRYWTMRGYRVERRFGWDTHGLPIEMEVEKRIGISGPRAIAEYGVDKYNEACRAEVQTNTENWERITRRIGRWIDFENDYKTMDLDFMESVWWVFRQLWDKGLIYKASKVLPYSVGATTPLSNFEANLDYRDVDDPSITVRLEITENQGPALAGDWLLIWTTTPWTLPSNLAVAVAEDLVYGAVVDADGRRQWMAVDRVESLFGGAATVSETARGAELLGVSYRPPFDYFGEERDRGAFRVISSPDVTTEEGTGLVHMAPAFGEADFFALQNAGLDVLVDPIDAEGRFTEAVPEVAGMDVKEADAVLIRMLKSGGLLVDQRTINHSYPFCWRTGTPLIYKAIPTWFVAVEQIKDRMVELNDTIHWVPDHIGSKRFGNWLEGARDWAISRNRYWGSAIPVWECDTGDHLVCVGSVEELFELSGVRLDDIHKHFVDNVDFPCSECAGTMHRIPEVLDCWFESGSMPFAQIHYPFENEERFASRFPANFIAEGIDQTRGWFYTLVVLSVALQDEVPFRNCVVNGHILAQDGRKMSKSLKNYEDPDVLLNEYGADALRTYLIDSPVLRGEPMRFTESGLREVIRSVMIPLWNAYSFFTTYAQADAITLADIERAPDPADRPEIDRWILSTLQTLIANVNEQMEGYYLYAVIKPTLAFIDDLTNWYIRRSRRRFWREKSEDDADKLAAFATLYEVLTTFAKVLAPVLPFITEQMYQGLVAEHQPDAPVSVHHCDFPMADESLRDPQLESDMESVRTTVRLGHNLRKQSNIRVRQPLQSVTIVTNDERVAASVLGHTELIEEELNVKEVLASHDEEALVSFSAKANFKILGPRLGAKMKDLAAAVEVLGHPEILDLQAGSTIEVAGETITVADLIIERTPRPGVVVASEGNLSVALDTALTELLRSEGMAREIVSVVQKMRRDQDLAVTDRITLTWETDDQELAKAFEEFAEMIKSETLATTFTYREHPGEPANMTVDGRPIHLLVTVDA